MKYLCISNAGEIEVAALTLLGATTKRDDDSKIGFFGTGNKYSLAWFLRNDLEVRIFSGEREFSVTTETEKLRDQEYRVICIEGQRTSITTDMGPGWEAWQAVRELYSNAMDEGDVSMRGEDEPLGKAGETRYYVAMHGGFLDIMNNPSKYFAHGREAIATTSRGEIYANGIGTIYYRGIRCNPQDTASTRGPTSRFDYDLSHIDITEERLYRSQNHIAVVISSMLVPLFMDKSILRELLTDTAIDGTWENEASKYIYPSGTISEPFIEAFRGELVSSPSNAESLTQDEARRATLVSDSVFSYALVKKETRDSWLFQKSVTKGMALPYEAVSSEAVNNQLQRYIDTSLALMRRAGLNVGFEVVIADIKKPDVLGIADSRENKIIISTAHATTGRQEVLLTLVEEYIHLKYEAKDFSREMQEAMLSVIGQLICRIDEQRLTAA